MALKNRGLPNGLGQMAFARATRPEKERVFAAVDEGSGGQITTRLRLSLALKAKSKLSRVLSGSRKAASLRRRSKSRSERRVSSSETSVAKRSIGAMGSACA